MSEIDDVRESFVQLWGSMGSFWGISPTTARVYAWLLSRSEAADSEAIMDGLELSRGAVSMACRELREWHLVEVEKLAGSRRASYRPATDLGKVTRNIVRIRKRREWDPVLEHLREWIPQLEAEDSEEAAILRQRLQSLESLVAQADSMVEMFLEGGIVSKVGLGLLVNASRPARRRAGRRSATSEPTARESSGNESSVNRDRADQATDPAKREDLVMQGKEER